MALLVAAFPANAALDSLVTKQMADAGIMGLGAAVIVDRQVVWMKGYGFADRARARPFTPNTIMNVGSIAKPFVGVAMMRAVHEGKLSLDEDINTYLPFRVVNPHHPNERITLRHLATHSSSITDRWEVYVPRCRHGGSGERPTATAVREYRDCRTPQAATSGDRGRREDLRVPPGNRLKALKGLRPH